MAEQQKEGSLIWLPFLSEKSLDDAPKDAPLIGWASTDASRLLAAFAHRARGLPGGRFGSLDEL